VSVQFDVELVELRDTHEKETLRGEMGGVGGDEGGNSSERARAVDDVHKALFVILRVAPAR
jgi:hypothetical protein